MSGEIRFNKFNVVFKLKILESSGDTGGHQNRSNFDINLANKFVRVRKGANPHGLKRVWVPKTTPILFDVGVGSHMT